MASADSFEHGLERIGDRLFHMALIKGRLFAENDDATGQAVAVIDETTMQRFFANEDPIGKRLQVGRPGADVPTATVVGVVGGAKYETLDAPPSPHIFLSLYQRSGRSISVVIKTRAASTV